MAKKELTEKEIAECIPDLWMPLTAEQREFLAENFTIQKFKKYSGELSNGLPSRS